ncbi:MAG TPA: NUDIX hydrolase, partial [Promineifilum sp.]|nr:NUDIX hydrolase [Promineifilum sp.]
MSNERMALFVATGLTADPLPMDIDEEITVETWPLEELVAMAIDGRLEDAKSVIAILRLAHHLSQQ